MWLQRCCSCLASFLYCLPLNKACSRVWLVIQLWGGDPAVGRWLVIQLWGPASILPRAGACPPPVIPTRHAVSAVVLNSVFSNKELLARSSGSLRHSSPKNPPAFVKPMAAAVALSQPRGRVKCIFQLLPCNFDILAAPGQDLCRHLFHACLRARRTKGSLVGGRDRVGDQRHRIKNTVPVSFSGAFSVLGKRLQIISQHHPTARL